MANLMTSPLSPHTEIYSYTVGVYNKHSHSSLNLTLSILTLRLAAFSLEVTARRLPI